MDKQEFKVGDRVWSVVHGLGRVRQVDKHGDYPLCVDLDCGKRTSFTKHGLYTTAHKNPCLFHANQGKIEFDTDEPIELEDGQPIWVRDSEVGEWRPRHFARRGQKAGVYCYDNGTTAHTNTTGATHWKYFRTTDPALDGASQ